MFRGIAPISLVLLLALCGGAADDKSPEQQKIDALTAEIVKLKADIEALKVENATLKEKLATTKPAGDLPATLYELGPAIKLGAYRYCPPTGWTAAPNKENKPAAMFRSPDKATVIQLVIVGKGAAPAEMQGQFAQSIVQRLKQDFVREKNEVLDPPVIIKDARFFVRVHERIKVKDKTADQTHLYLPVGRDMVQVAVITTIESSDQIAAAQHMAEELTLSVKPEK